MGPKMSYGFSNATPFDIVVKLHHDRIIIRKQTESSSHEFNAKANVNAGTNFSGDASYNYSGKVDSEFIG